jgi:hypothetical protein
MRANFRRRSEEVRSSLIATEQLAESSMLVGLPSLPGEGDPEAWVMELARAKGLHTWEEILIARPLPDRILLAHAVTDDPEPADRVTDSLTAALILARTGGLYYQPNGPFIFSRSRLSRTLRLTHLNLSRYYELD